MVPAVVGEEKSLRPLSAWHSRCPTNLPSPSCLSTNLGGNSEQEVFSDGLTNDIITDSFEVQAPICDREQFYFQLQG